MLATAQRSLYFFTTLMTTKSSVSSAASSAADGIASHFSAIPEVEAVVLAGSRLSQFADDHSDVDLYVYGSGIVATSLRAEIARSARLPRSATRSGNQVMSGSTSKPGLLST
jgi:predicted nucleotidyltransferase